MDVFIHAMKSTVEYSFCMKGKIKIVFCKQITRLVYSDSKNCFNVWLIWTIQWIVNQVK